MKNLRNLFNNKQIEYLFYLISFSLFLLIYGDSLDFGRTYDDDLLYKKFTNSPGDAKLISSYLYAKFHFYPIYFLSHELDFNIVKLLNFLRFEVTDLQVAKFTNIFLHVTNSYLIYVLLKILTDSENNSKNNVIIFLSSLFFLFHPITSQIIFNITTRNESLALFFGLLTFIYSFKFYEQKKLKDLAFVILLFFFSLCSKLMTVFLVGLIPLTLFLKNFYHTNLKENLKKNYDIFISLIIIFFIYYYLRNQFTEENKLIFYTDFNDLIFNFFTTAKFYLRGLFFPYEHIYIYAGNYDLVFSIIITSIYLILFIFSFLIFFKKKDALLLIGFFWINASLFIPLLFGLVEKGFPLISKLAERYQYSATAGLPILITWIFLNLKQNYIIKYLTYGLSILILISSIFILNERKKVYVNNVIFFTKAHENSPKNVHRYFFEIGLSESIKENNPSKYLFHLYQLYSVNNENVRWTIEFIKFFMLNDNKKGMEFFEKRFEEVFNEPPDKFKLAGLYFDFNRFEKAKVHVSDIFDKYEELEKQYDNKQARVTFIEPTKDDLYFFSGLIEYNLGNYQKAIKDFTEANLINPLHGTALYNAAITLKKIGLTEEAAKMFEQAITINPFLRETTNNLMLRYGN